MKRRLGYLGVVFLLATIYGCEREKRQDSVVATETPSAAPKPATMLTIDEKGWLAYFGRNSSALSKLLDSSSLFSDFLQGKYLSVIESYDGLVEPSEVERIICARSALDLSVTAKTLEDLLSSIQPEILKIERTRPGADSKEIATVISELEKQVGGHPSEGSGGASILSKLVTDGFETRQSLLRKLATNGQPPSLKRFNRSNKRLGDFDYIVSSGSGTSVKSYSFIDLTATGVTRLYFAKRALDCLSNVTSEVTLLKAQSLRLSDQGQQARTLLESYVSTQNIPTALQFFSAQTSFQAYELALDLERRLLGLKPKFVGLPTHGGVPFYSLWRDVVQAADASEANAEANAYEELDPVSLSRSLMGTLKEKTIEDEATASALVSRYVDSLLRLDADRHLYKGQIARSAQIRRRIGGVKGYEVGPKVPPSSLAMSAYEHWKIVEPRSAIRYLKDLGDSFPNAYRSVGLLRDVLSYRARQASGQSAAGQ